MSRGLGREWAGLTAGCQGSRLPAAARNAGHNGCRGQQQPSTPHTQETAEQLLRLQCGPLTELAQMPHPNLSKVHWRTHLATWPVPAPCRATVRHPRFLIRGRSPAPEDDRLTRDSSVARSSGKNRRASSISTMSVAPGMVSRSQRDSALIVPLLRDPPPVRTRKPLRPRLLPPHGWQPPGYRGARSNSCKCPRPASRLRPRSGPGCTATTAGCR